MVSGLIGQLNFQRIRELYDNRNAAHRALRFEFDHGNIEPYVHMALGLDDATANYSATEHGLGPKIIASSSPARIFELASELFRSSDPREIPDVIYRANIHHLKISVGSEMAAMLRPDHHWITNVRTVYSSLLLKHQGNLSKANEQLSLYRGDYGDSEMDYDVWRYIHPYLGPDLLELDGLASKQASMQGVEASNFNYLWADAIADALYAEYSTY